ncbi:MAG: uncharacterized protein KVP18_003850 [Porospora cf. gigantea A]|uniref:uncharacterized protein n=1 Tax=Porospora cf. gigantea A TaxID=2853593 RepID=UPI0035596ADE|nr:MAG: hypothetical protein KVP18_003850 [Porospora cf. gigantea A]
MSEGTRSESVIDTLLKKRKFQSDQISRDLSLAQGTGANDNCLLVVLRHFFGLDVDEVKVRLYSRRCGDDSDWTIGGDGFLHIMNSTLPSQATLLIYMRDAENRDVHVALSDCSDLAMGKPQVLLCKHADSELAIAFHSPHASETIWEYFQAGFAGQFRYPEDLEDESDPPELSIESTALAPFTMRIDPSELTKRLPTLQDLPAILELLQRCLCFDRDRASKSKFVLNIVRHEWLSALLSIDPPTDAKFILHQCLILVGELVLLQPLEIDIWRNPFLLSPDDTLLTPIVAVFNSDDLVERILDLGQELELSVGAPLRPVSKVKAVFQSSQFTRSLGSDFDDVIRQCRLLHRVRTFTDVARFSRGDSDFAVSNDIRERIANWTTVCLAHMMTDGDPQAAMMKRIADCLLEDYEAALFLHSFLSALRRIFSMLIVQANLAQRNHYAPRLSRAFLDANLLPRLRGYITGEGCPQIHAQRYAQFNIVTDPQRVAVDILTFSGTVAPGAVAKFFSELHSPTGPPENFLALVDVYATSNDEPLIHHVTYLIKDTFASVESCDEPSLRRDLVNCFAWGGVLDRMIAIFEGAAPHSNSDAVFRVSKKMILELLISILPAHVGSANAGVIPPRLFLRVLEGACTMRPFNKKFAVAAVCFVKTLMQLQVPLHTGNSAVFNIWRPLLWLLDTSTGLVRHPGEECMLTNSILNLVDFVVGSSMTSLMHALVAPENATALSRVESRIRKSLRVSVFENVRRILKPLAIDQLPTAEEVLAMEEPARRRTRGPSIVDIMKEFCSTKTLLMWRSP